MAIEHFNEIPVVAGCILFVDLLGLDSYAMRVDIESANFILRDLDRSENTRFDTEERLRTFIGRHLLFFYSKQFPSKS